MPYDFSVIGMEEKLAGRIFTILVLTEQNSLVTIIAFFLVAYAFTWIFHGLIILLHLPFRRITKSAAQVLYVLGLGGPLVAALLLAYLSYGQVGATDLLNGALNWRTGLIWYLFAIAPIGIIYLVNAVVHRPPQKERFALLQKPSKSLLMLVLAQVWVVIAEEFGWRGFALPHLQRLFGWLGAGLILGILWASWHLPMFFVPRSNQYGSSFPQYVYALIVWSFVMTMLYYQTNGSILLCMIFHAAANLWGSIINLPKGAERLAGTLHLPVLLIAMALLLV